jgi:hypothetical protein
MAKIVEKDGSLYRLTDADYRRLLTFVAAGMEYDLWELGAHIGYIHASMANFEKDDAEFELSRFGSGPVRKPVPATSAGAKSQRSTGRSAARLRHSTRRVSDLVNNR